MILKYGFMLLLVCKLNKNKNKNKQTKQLVQKACKASIIFAWLEVSPNTKDENLYSKQKQKKNEKQGQNKKG